MLRLNIAFDEVQRTRAFHRSALPTRMKGTRRWESQSSCLLHCWRAKTKIRRLSKMGPKPERISEEQLRDTNTLFSIS